jgi:hypothetical protein
VARFASFDGSCFEINLQNYFSFALLFETLFSGRKTGSNSSQIKVTKMLLIVSTVFVCLNLPSYVMRLRAYIQVSSCFNIKKFKIHNWKNSEKRERERETEKVRER